MVVTQNRSIDEGLVLYLPMTEGTGTKVFDRSQYGNHGTFLTGTEVPTWVTGKDSLGKALSFDGGDGVTISDSPSLRVTNDITLSVWFKKTDFAGTQMIIDSYDGGSGYCTLYISGNTPRFSIRDSDGNSLSVDFDDTITVVDVWHHIVGVRGDGEFKIFWNGRRQDDSVVDTYAQINSDGDWGICKQLVGSDYYFNGVVQDLRIYNRGLSDNEVRTLYNMRRRV